MYKSVLGKINKLQKNIDHQHGRWMQLKEALRVQTHTEVLLRTQ